MLGDGFFGGSDPAFHSVGIVVPIVFLLAIVLIGAVIAKGILQWLRNNRSPVLTVEARVLNLRVRVSGGTHDMGDGILRDDTRTGYYATFEVSSGDRMEFAVGGGEYGLLSQGDMGSLTFQGTRYLGFQRR